MSQKEFFETKIRPVLVAHCYECHSDAEQSGGLLLDSRRSVLRGGDSGPTVIVGQPNHSLLVEALQYESLEMPPDGKLPDEVIADFKKWIGDGLFDPRVDEDSTEKRESLAPPVKPEELWSLQPIVDYESPQVGNASWAVNDIDRFVFSRMEQAGVRPVREAEPNRLLRRLYFDLIGLPPPADELEEFLIAHRADRDDAVRDVVEQLLASPHFGERWGRHWLDVARYAESNGMAWNVTLPYAWRYRDYVIDAFNADKPYNQFVREQLAGDLMPSESEQQRREQLVATGFLAIGPKSFYRREKEIPEVKPDWADEQINVVGKSLLGLTIACARCHDHKFDPIPTRDYYALAGIFMSTELHSGPKVSKPSEWKLKSAHDERAIALVDEDEMQKKLLKAKEHAALNKRLAALKKKSNADPQAVKALTNKVNRLKRESSLEYAFGVADSAEPAPTEIRIRGEWDQLGETVPRGFLTAIDSVGEFAIPEKQSGRAQLAEWIVDPHNPLTARVFVNRVWHHLFGQGLVKSVDNFGSKGTPPTHPRLLDYLAHRFVHEHQWSVKALIRDCVLSRTYQLASLHDINAYRIDPENELLWRSRSRRLQAEAIRDSLLAVAGKLESEPENTSTVEELGYRMLRPNDLIRLRRQHEYRSRSVYLPVFRGVESDDLLAVFDFPEPSMGLGVRDVSTVPSQSLYMMNAPLVLDAAESLAKRALAENDQIEARVNYLFQTLYSRLPTDGDLNAAKRLLSSLPGDELARWSIYCHSLFLSAEFTYLL
ncbi:PSD1 and planctomycete cytochrome C domain-containing protein [Stratiformator vulcanicus]|uniref:PSD1 and planctomycete cytochrome C domain-containing protein n=1 Tax=Stratiformator vulcanicus TaxID=2527980 RepID=UPI002877656C|nr:PSD1 and planctomycete cytochrome C domain-containing protein [Stratiformator vulcanicus]